MCAKSVRTHRKSPDFRRTPTNSEEVTNRAVVLFFKRNKPLRPRIFETPFIRWMSGVQAQTILATKASEIPTNYAVQKNPRVRALNQVLRLVAVRPRAAVSAPPTPCRGA